MNKYSSESANIYVGLDISHKTMVAFVLYGKKSNLVNSIPCTHDGLAAFLNVFPNPSKVCVALETGTHSNWISRYISSCGFDVIVAHARDLALIYASDKKNDHLDAEKLARLAKADRKLLHPVKLISAELQRDLVPLKARDLLVRQRTTIINSIRGHLRSAGCSDCGLTADNMKTSLNKIPSVMQEVLAPLFQTLNAISSSIKSYDKQITKLCRKYKETGILRQIPGVGPAISLAFVLFVGNYLRFENASSISSYFGLVPKQDQSGEMDKQLGISKQGNKLMRRLLVQGAQYILGPFGPPCELREFGERLAQRGGKIAKRKAKVAVARKLSTVMLALWKNPDIPYDAYFKHNSKTKREAA
ncbi:MAG: IS110 family transposase [Victivallales bacterium]|nr:IS110 family transposase [Victivallales bacterium]